MGMDKERIAIMTGTPIFTNLQTLTDDIRTNAYKRGHLAARLEVLKAIDQIDLEQRTATYAITQLLRALGEIETPPAPPKVETRGRKKKNV
jgi:hypothetical protein